ncbi:nuclear transport factor 2 family protein [Sabulicella glaciei]|uniref:Nuclear transport factor 2 family protein n=1 Tax=Sabulicella glaciei TaxID=2984948 RepID=A0ABT3NU67_9PROT|nr:nuclear transport factor 2 family protein [Roseococcus sp. MDT2-1-1]MCW8085707.1 nuclear transport factor 2 family protein [Roseococcus sp. MDT2-1-1]
MDFTRRSVGVLGGAIIVAAAMGQQGAQAQSGDEQAVAQAIDALSEAMIAVDRSRLEALTADGLSYGHSAGRVENKQQFIDYLVSRASSFRSINLSDKSVSVLGNTAIARHTLTGETVNAAGQVTPVRIGVMQVWQKSGNDWRLLARQAFRI